MGFRNSLFRIACRWKQVVPSHRRFISAKFDGGYKTPRLVWTTRKVIIVVALSGTAGFFAQRVASRTPDTSRELRSPLYAPKEDMEQVCHPISIDLKMRAEQDANIEYLQGNN
jgi:hypothetical protein